MHPALSPVVEPLRQGTGHIWPRLQTTTVVESVEVIRWGHNLGKPCKKVTGLRLKDFRDRFATQLREHDFNQVNIERVMGHSASSISSSYGGKNWERYVVMINAIK